MLEGKSILCFAPEPWDGLWRNRHQIMSRLARRNSVLFVEQRPYLRDVLHRLRHSRQAWWQLFVPRLRHVQNHLWVYRDPDWAPLSGHPLLGRVTETVRLALLRRVMRRLGMEAPLLWLFRPEMGDLAGKCGERLLIYHCVDEYAAYEMEFQGVPGSTSTDVVRQQEERLLRRADIVFVTAKPLLERKRAYNSNVHLVPNGVDYAAFQQALINPIPLADMEKIPHPRLGVVGAINEKVDLALLRQVALARPAWSLVLVGPVTQRYHLEQVEALRLPNVYFLGHKPVQAVPYYVVACDVCLMPYKVNEWTRHINPLKLYEYLALGKPVVSTPIPAAQAHADLLYLADAALAFVARAEEALAEEPTLAERRQCFAAMQTWDNRIEQLSAVIETTLARCAGTPSAW